MANPGSSTRGCAAQAPSPRSATGTARLFAPGAPREDYFETLARISVGETMTGEERAAFMLPHDTFWV